MRALSKPTDALIAELAGVARERSGARAGGDRTASAIVALLGQIADAREPLAIPHIISLTLDDQREVAETAGDAVASLRQLVGVRDLGIFDRAFRERSPWLHGEIRPWYGMNPAELRTVAGLRTGPTLLQLAMCHRSGYVRAEAIRRSATSADGAEIGFLLLRTNDWVTPVRELAHTALRARLTLGHVPDLVVALPIIDAMPRWARSGSTKILEEIEALLRDPRSLGALIAASTSPDPFLRRAAYRRLFELGRLDFVAPALRDTDPGIRAWIARWLIAAGENELLPFSAGLLHSRLGSIRFGTAHRLVALGRPIPWADLLLDAHAGVRALAQTAALAAGTSPDDEYRARLATATGSRLGVSLVGLSETGGPSDIELVRRFVPSDRPVVRRGALVALARMEVDDVVPLALSAFFDDSPTVTRAARDLLLARIASLTARDVWPVLTSTTSLAGKIAALAVLSSLGLWDGLPYLLRATRDDAVTEFAARRIERWLARERRSFVVPSPAVAADIRSALAEANLRDELRRGVSSALAAHL